MIYEYRLQVTMIYKRKEERNEDKQKRDIALFSPFFFPFSSE